MVFGSPGLTGDCGKEAEIHVGYNFPKFLTKEDGSEIRNHTGDIPGGRGGAAQLPAVPHDYKGSSRAPKTYRDLCKKVETCHQQDGNDLCQEQLLLL
jgi:hypothetical protein